MTYCIHISRFAPIFPSVPVWRDRQGDSGIFGRKTNKYAPISLNFSVHVADRKRITLISYVTASKSSLLKNKWGILGVDWSNPIQNVALRSILTDCRVFCTKSNHSVFEKKRSEIWNLVHMSASHRPYEELHWPSFLFCFAWERYNFTGILVVFGILKWLLYSEKNTETKNKTRPARFFVYYGRCEAFIMCTKSHISTLKTEWQTPGRFCSWNQPVYACTSYVHRNWSKRCTTGKKRYLHF